jgi:hypothetical protein
MTKGSVELACRPTYTLWNSDDHLGRLSPRQAIHLWQRLNHTGQLLAGTPQTVAHSVDAMIDLLGNLPQRFLQEVAPEEQFLL